VLDDDPGKAEPATVDRAHVGALRGPINVGKPQT
jgi:hypothetical protein